MSEKIPQSLIDEQAAKMVGCSFEAGVAFIRNARSAGIPYETLQALTQSRDHPWWKHLDELVPKPEVSVRFPPDLSESNDGQAFYEKFFGLKPDLSAVRIPVGLDRTLFIAEGVSINMAVKAHVDRNIPFWKYCGERDLESVIRESERGPVKASYSIRVRKGREVDSDLKKLSAEDIAAQGIDTESLLERLIHGLKYYDETNEHLDVKTVTLCAGSRYAGGDVPRVDRDDGGFVGVDRCAPQRRHPSLGARRAVR